MDAKPVVITHIYFQTAELKQAITLWVQENNMLIQELIENLAKKILASGDYSISVDKVYEDTVKAPNLRMVTCGLDYDLLERIDVSVKLSNPKEDAKFRSRFINEAIRRYLEPQLIESGLLKTTVFLNRKQAAKNLKVYREILGLKPKEFLQKYFDTMISYPQYSLIERSASGNVDRLIDHLAKVDGLDKVKFYGGAVEFWEYAKRKR